MTMAKLTKKQRAAIQSAIASMQAAIGDIMDDRTVLARKNRVNIETAHCGFEYRKPVTTGETVDYKGRDDSAWSITYVDALEETAKHGRHFVQAFSAVRTLETLLSEGN